MLWLKGSQRWRPRHKARTLVDVKGEIRLHALADTVEEVGAETLYKTLIDTKRETLV